MALRSDEFQLVLSEFKLINERLRKLELVADSIQRRLDKAKTLNQLRVEKNALLKYIHELEGFYGLQRKGEKDIV